MNDPYQVSKSGFRLPKPGRLKTAFWCCVLGSSALSLLFALLLGTHEVRVEGGFDETGDTLIMAVLLALVPMAVSIILFLLILIFVRKKGLFYRLGIGVFSVFSLGLIFLLFLGVDSVNTATKPTVVFEVGNLRGKHRKLLKENDLRGFDYHAVAQGVNFSVLWVRKGMPKRVGDDHLKLALLIIEKKVLESLSDVDENRKVKLMSSEIVSTSNTSGVRVLVSYEAKLETGDWMKMGFATYSIIDESGAYHLNVKVASPDKALVFAEGELDLIIESLRLK